MCGIVGVMTSDMTAYQRPHNNFFTQALFADTLRGFDSTGIALLDAKSFAPTVYKRALSAPDFLQLTKAKDLIGNNTVYNFMLGHNRAATRGRVEDNTAHPFQIGAITMVHNGTITNHRQLKDGNKFTVDSEAIANSIAAVGPEETIEKIDGAFALVWHDADDDTINIIRNKERPLWLGISEDEDSVYFCSEGSMLQWLAIRNGIKLKHIFQPTEGYLHKYSIAGHKDWATKPEVVELKLHKPFRSTVPATQTTNTAFRNRQSSGRQTTNDVLKKINQKEEIVFTLEKFEPYTTKSMGEERGKLVGRIRGLAANHRVVIFNCTMKDFDMYSNSILMGEVLHAYHEAGDARKPIILQVAEGSLVEYEVDEENKVVDMEGNPVAKKTSCESQQKSSGDSSDSGGDNKTEDDESGDEELPFEYRYVRGPNGSSIAIDVFKMLTKDGCAFCSGQVYPEDSEDLGWTRDRQPVCPDCIDVEGTRGHGFLQ